MDNINDIRQSIENQLNNTMDIGVINNIITQFENAINNGKDVTEDMDIRSSDNGFLCYTQLELSKCQDMISSMMDRCTAMEEYEMCRRIDNILKEYDRKFKDT